MSRRHNTGMERKGSSDTQGFVGDLRAGWREFQKETSSGHKRVLTLLLLVGCGLRAALLVRPVGVQEAAIYMHFIHRPFADLFVDLALPANHILHTALSRLSTMVFGAGVIPLRLPAFLAGILCLPMFYLFVRAMFNRYIALIALALVCASGPLIELSAQAEGYSIAWFCFIGGLLLGRHFIKTNSAVSAVLIGLLCAMGVWALPGHIYAVGAIFIWLLISLTMAYENSLRERMLRLVLAFLVAVSATLMCYLPVLQAQGFDQLVNHHTTPRLDWATFSHDHLDMALDLWAYVVDSTALWLAIAGIVGLVHAAFISSKYRALVFSLAASAVLIVLLWRRMEAPQTWVYTLFILHLSSAIAVFYLLKSLQEKLFTSWEKRARSVLSAVVLFVALAIPGFRMARARYPGSIEAYRLAGSMTGYRDVDTRLYAQHPWDAPVGFNLLANGLGLERFNTPSGSAREIWVAVGPLEEQSVEGVLRHYGEDPGKWPSMHVVHDWPGLKIFAAP